MSADRVRGGSGQQQSGIGASGGTVNGPNGATIVIPAGALSQNTNIAIAQSSTGAPALPSGLTAVGEMFALTPHGTQFATPVTITIPFNESTTNGTTPLLYKTNATILLRILDHIHVVDRIFKHHLCEMPHAFNAPRSDEMPHIRQLAKDADEVDDWYACYVPKLAASEFDESLKFAFTDGTPARMTRGEIVLHVCMHGTYHRGNAGLLLQKNGISPNNDRISDVLAAAA